MAIAIMSSCWLQLFAIVSIELRPNTFKVSCLYQIVTQELFTDNVINDSVKVKDSRLTSDDDLGTVKAIEDLSSGEVHFDNANDFLVFLWT